MLERHRVILKGGVQIRLGQMPRVACPGPNRQVRQLENFNQLPVVALYGRHPAGRKMSGGHQAGQGQDFQCDQTSEESVSHFIHP